MSKKKKKRCSSTTNLDEMITMNCAGNSYSWNTRTHELQKSHLGSGILATSAFEIGFQE
jgi:hypothetical protein